ncbi:YIP1 family protein [Natranaeroarchaeum aerophilus]|uniref:YIP1 family protein n=1 Tax=Natranaeroarchaeum aerophilus TaxID=2917711 RepID=A0AAE3FRP8_9EURY|nr:YIP1 family protein [Natranaeroarchaeum aerophilus]MCL9813860.1 YIP1 family protein [Natranaeroarchaeum aerophilus]
MSEPAHSRASDGLGTTLLRAVPRVLLSPRRFFRTSILPGEQAPGLLFAMGVVLVSETIRLVLVSEPLPVFGGSSVLSAILWLSVVVLFVTPAALHLIAALQTMLLIPVANDRAGVSETVQVLAYSSAPCLFAGVPIPEIRVLVGAYATVLLLLGLSEVHGISFERSLLVGSLPAALAFGYGFRAFDALTTLLARWYII